MVASDDDSTPILQMWDLRNAHSPAKVRSFLCFVSGPIPRADTLDAGIRCCQGTAAASSPCPGEQCCVASKLLAAQG